MSNIKERLRDLGGYLISLTLIAILLFLLISISSSLKESRKIYAELYKRYLDTRSELKVLERKRNLLKLILRATSKPAFKMELMIEKRMEIPKNSILVVPSLRASEGETSEHS